MRRLPVLVIEDNGDFAEYLARIVDDTGYKAFVASSVEEALRLLATRPYSLVLADYLGPREQFLRRWPILQLLARFAPSTPVVAVTPLEDVPASKNLAGTLPLSFTGEDLAKELRQHALSRPKEIRCSMLARYLAALWDADGHEAAKVVDEAMRASWSLQAIYEGLFTAALHEIGYWWQTDSCSVAEEHGARAMTEQLMSRVVAGFKRQPPKEQSILLACMAGERHELGAHMAADLFAQNGWKVRFLGADTPEADVAVEARRFRVDVVGLSATIQQSWGIARSQIATLRQAGAKTVILGGQAFETLSQEAIANLGADGKAKSATDGLEMANDLIARSLSNPGG